MIEHRIFEIVTRTSLQVISCCRSNAEIMPSQRGEIGKNEEFHPIAGAYAQTSISFRKAVPKSLYTILYRRDGIIFVGQYKHGMLWLDPDDPCKQRSWFDIYPHT